MAGFPQPKKNLVKGECAAQWCKGTPIVGRLYCSKCKARKYKHNHTSKYSYNLLKSGAGRRKIRFTLTFQQWEKFWARHPEQWGLKKANILRSNNASKRSNRWTWEVDRINTKGPYSADNIQLMQKYNNVAKSNRDRAVYLGTGKKPLKEKEKIEYAF